MSAENLAELGKYIVGVRRKAQRVREEASGRAQEDTVFNKKGKHRAV